MEIHCDTTSLIFPQVIAAIARKICGDAHGLPDEGNSEKSGEGWRQPGVSSSSSSLSIFLLRLFEVCCFFFAI